MSGWTNYKQAADLPSEMVEAMWRALDRINTACEQTHPAHIDFMSKGQIAELCRSVSPSSPAPAAQAARKVGG